MTAYMATVQILITDVASEGEACDAVSEPFRELFADWSYLQVGGQFLSPTETARTFGPDYKEGDAFIPRREPSARRVHCQGSDVANVWLPTALLKTIDTLAEQDGLSRTDAIVSLIQGALTP
jgi:hypothetical protein|tara:strand:+ start:183 stop:548 length:366 start_codon:yes stop_codon:yes gene_type:complete